MRTPAVLILLAFLGLAGRADASFVHALGSPFPTAPPARALALADVDRNGTLDVASGTLSLRLGDGTGRLGDAAAVAPTGHLDGAVAEDFNGDGLIDFAAIERGATDDRLLLFEALPAGGYTGGAIEEDVGEATRIAAADINRDSRLDIAIAREDMGGRLTILFSDLTSAAFDRTDLSSTVGPVRGLAIADFTLDGPPDVVLGSAGGALELLVNDGLGGLTAEPATSTGGTGSVDATAVGDFDGDGRPDLAASDGTRIALLRGDGSGGLQPFGPARGSGLPAPIAALASGDLNGDGRADVAAGGSTGSSVAALLGDGRGALVPTLGSPFTTGGPVDGRVGAVAVADMNRDLQPDLVAANEGGSVSVLLNADTGLLAPNPISVGFGSVPAAAPGRSHTITLQSIRGRLRITRVAVVAGSRAFTAGPGSCLDRVLLVGQACAVTVGFKARRRAERLEALLSVDANAAAVIVPLTATVRPPEASRLRLRPKLLRPRPGGGRRSMRAATMRLRYRLSEAARVRVRVQRRLQGRRARDRRCVPVRRANRKRGRCRIWKVVRTVARPGAAGPNLLRLRTGVGARRLANGRYRLSVSAADRFRNRSREMRIAFRVKARKGRKGRKGPGRSQAARRPK